MISFKLRNVDAKPGHYEKIKDIFRPNHADFTYFKKYGIRDYRGGGRSSARETVARVLGGAIARQILYHYTGANIIGYTKQIGAIVATGYECDYIETNIVRSPDINTTESMITCIQEVAKAGDSIGGIVECRIVGIPVGIGEPVFGKLKARLASSMLSIGGVLGFEYGKGFEACSMKGSQYNDPFIYENNRIHPKNNYCGGVLGGISTGDDVIFRVALKPTSSIYQQQTSVDMGGNVVEFMIGGRHDPCIVPRAVPIIEAMAAIDCLDLYMIHRAKTFNY